MKDVHVAGRRVKLDPSMVIGSGGEADVFDIGGGVALKLFKPPEHPDYNGDTLAQEAARDRLESHQRKLRDFPVGLPARVVAPQTLVTDRSGRRVVGYTMPLVTGADLLMRFSDATFRRAGLTGERVAATFRDLHATLAGLHSRGVVIGDFNDLNVLVKAAAAYLVDADSFQFGPHVSPVFTDRFLDPLRCDASAPAFVPARPASESSDWYAYHVMLMSSLLLVGPYGGVYRPRDPAQRIAPATRPLHRITVFHPDVQYPKPAFPAIVLPDELLHRFHEVFERDARGALPLPLLDSLAFTRCVSCGQEHARLSCPTCAPLAAAATKMLVTVRGSVRAHRVFETRGVIVHAGVESGTPRWLTHEGSALRSEDGTPVLQGALDPSLRFRRLPNRTTAVARGNELVLLGEDGAVERLAIDSCEGEPIFDVNERHLYWAHGGSLLRRPHLAPRVARSPLFQAAPEVVGSVLARQTRFWVGPRFGCGFYRAGGVTVAFVNDSERSGLKEVDFPRLVGQVVDARCVLDEQRAWLLLALQHAGKTIHRCLVVRRDGVVEAAVHAEPGDGSWLETLTGKVAVAGFLLAATDSGLARVEVEGRGLVKTRDFPDTEPFVDSGCKLLPGRDGALVVGERTITLLTMS